MKSKINTDHNESKKQRVHRSTRSPYASIVKQYARIKAYNDFLESTVDDEGYSAYLEHIAQPRANEH